MLSDYCSRGGHLHGRKVWRAALTEVLPALPVEVHCHPDAAKQVENGSWCELPGWGQLRRLPHSPPGEGREAPVTRKSLERVWEVQWWQEDQQVRVEMAAELLLMVMVPRPGGAPASVDA